MTTLPKLSPGMQRALQGFADKLARAQLNQETWVGNYDVLSRTSPNGLKTYWSKVPAHTVRLLLNAGVLEHKAEEGVYGRQLTISYRLTDLGRRVLAGS